MSWDEEQAGQVVRRALTLAPVPPTGVDVGAVLRAGRRAERRRRRLTVALAAVAVLAVGGGSAVVLDSVHHDRSLPVTGRSPEVLPPPTVVPVTVTLSKDSAPCVYEQFPVPKEVWFPTVQAADPTGRFLVGTAGVSNKATDRDRAYLVLWDQGDPSLFELPKAVRVEPIAVNASGLVVGVRYPGNGKPGLPWAYQDEKLRNLTLPSGYDGGQSSAVNDRGDILGGAYDSARRVGVPVIWPAGNGPPQVLGKPAKYRMFGWTADGTIVGMERDPHAGVKAEQKLRLWRPDGSTAVRTAPADWAPGSPRGEVALRGDWVAGIVPGATVKQRGRPATTAKSPPAVWNVRTGELVVYQGLDTRNHYSVVTDPQGRLLVGVPGGGWRMVERDGTARPVPLPPNAHPEYGPQPVLIDDLGTIYGAVREEPAGQNRPTVWRCP
ncbi:hypothetical protein [Micromonospora coerulea]|uniref:hypothetical protein n=1 Tax=Micromonospora coerulea TaxID=47856 RepID=UPI001906ACCD|nr:hypothetical protein [Micromonospora veneta]